MSDPFYTFIWHLFYPAFWTSSSPTVIGSEHTRRPGPYILASTHESPYDVPLLMRHAARKLDFVSITEVFQNPFVAWFYGNMNAFPLDRSRPDPKTLRTLLHRLEQGRVVAMFPEGRLSPGEKSVIHTGKIRPGIGRIAQLANVPIIPAVVINSGAYSRFTSWLPHRRTRYGIIFGQPIDPHEEPDQTERTLVDNFLHLHATLSEQMHRPPRRG